VLFLHEQPMHTTDWVTRWTRLTPPDLVVCPSHYVAGTVPTLFPGVPVEIIYHPVEPAPADQATLALLRATTRAQLGVGNDTVVIIQACRPSASKGNLQLVRALAKLRDLPQWICLQVGQPLRAVDVQYFDDVKKSAADLLIAERVRFLGYQRDPIPLLAAADIHCQPNIGAEAFGLVFIEALYARLPVVATAMGGPLEIVDESCGLLVPAGDIDSLAEALGSLIRDPGLRRRLGTAGPARAHQLCDPPTQMARLESLFSKTTSCLSNSSTVMAVS
jgi:glycosyltransferase involved in cell wall biosynthesis